MVKAEIIEKLHGYGEVWANSSYSKKYLEDHLADCEKARSMSLEELRAKINERKHT